MAISSSFDSGHVVVIDDRDVRDIRLALAEDNASDFKHWFHFRLTGARDQAVTIRFGNAVQANTNRGLTGMPDPWDNGYRAVASYDRQRWFRVPTTFDGERLAIEFEPERDSVYVATWAPYTMEQHRSFVARCLERPEVSLAVLGQSLEGQDIDLLRVGTGKRQVWITTRQHPSETMGSYCVEGLVDRLLDPDDALAKSLLDKAVFHIVPNMNPDGSRRGNTRSNAAGVNLNRVWSSPSPETAPEVHLVRAAMQATGVDLSLDVHGWSGTHNYLGAPLGLPSLTQKQVELGRRYESALARANPDFQEGWPYPGGGPGPGEADLGMSWNWIGEHFDALALLYELSFKDIAARPDPVHGWSPQRSRRFGASTLDAMAAVIDDVR